MSTKQTKIEKYTKAINKSSDPKKEKKKKIVFDEEDEVENEKVNTKGFEIKQSNSKVEYQKLELHEQILKRPDTYVKSIRTMLDPEPVYIMNENKIIKKQISYPLVLIRIYVEVLSNAIDNVWRSLSEKITPKFIKINIDKENNTISIWNDGKNITTTNHSQLNIPIPEMIFGHLLTSSNYNDNEERKTSGRNGYGVKLCNIFSNYFKVDVYNKEEAILYTQEWSDNMFKRQPAKFDKVKTHFPKSIEDGKNGFTCITFKPDLDRFGLSEITDDVFNLLKRIAYDTAMTASLNKVQTYFNNELIPITGIKDYVSMFFDTLPEEHMIFSSDDSRVMIVKDKEFNHMSFVNGIYTRNGGIHIDTWCEELFRPIVNKINDQKANKDRKKININDIKKHFFVFVYADSVNPEFDEQSKSKLVSPIVKTHLRKTDIPKIMKWSFIQEIEQMLSAKELNTLKNETEKKRGHIHIEKLEDANFAGKKEASKCILCITEGLSAKPYAVEGMKYGFNGVKGRDYFGVLPIKGKFLNVRNSSIKTLIDNAEVKALIQVMGLETGLDYTNPVNFKRLRYGKLMCICDADPDGTHITGLLYNFFHTLFPTLLKVDGFFNFMRVPIVKIKKNKKVINFFNQYQANQYITQNNIKKEHVNYFKGLGTSESADVKEDFGRRVVTLKEDEKTTDIMNNIFSKENTDFRKEWLKTYDPAKPFADIDDYKVEELSIDEFINNELINFSIEDCKRSIPSMIDGFKESIRKVIYTIFKKNIKYEDTKIKVAQFAAIVAQLTNYHHGEDNLSDTITRLAQRFVGANNIPLLFNAGQFGTRLEMGKDASSPRYIFTKMDQLTRLIFREEDDEFLLNAEDDGDVVEKKNYIPIVPMILVNGISAGIGTGWSCSIPSYNIIELINILKQLLENNNPNFEIKPYYRNFQGTVEVEGSKVITKGVYEIVDEKKRKYKITEIPLGKKNISISKYKTILEDLQEAGKIKDIINHCDSEIVNFTVTASEDFEVNHESLGLVDTNYLNNMVMFDKDDKIKKYENIEEIIREYYSIRYDFYKVRKDGLIKNMEKELLFLRNKINFLECVLNNKITLKDKSMQSLEEELLKRKFDKIDDSYEYLLSIQVRHMTGEKLTEIKEKEKKLNKAYDEYKKKKIETIWIEELDELLEKYVKWEKENTVSKTDRQEQKKK